MRVRAILNCLLLLLSIFPYQSAFAADSLPIESPIALRDLDFVRRDLRNLALRHSLPVPPAEAGRQQLGLYFWQIVTALAKLPKAQMNQSDYAEIGRLTSDFEELVQEVKGKLTMVVAQNDLPAQIPGAVSEEKGAEFNERLSVLEKVKINGDFTFLPQADSGRGIKDTLATNMRGRINFQCKVSEPQPDSMMGDAKLFLRLTAASGRFFPRNKYLMSPENDVVDYAANPYNTGINETQVSNLQINNNNSNNVRPTVSMEQAWYGQDLRFSKTLKGNYQVGLNNFSNVFDANTMANNETMQFLNTQFVNNISWRPNFIGPSTIFQIEKSLLRDRAFIRAMSGMISLADRDYFGGYGTNHELQLGHRFFKKEGNLRAGFWNFNFRSGSSKPFTTPLDLSPSGLLSILPGGTPSSSRPVGCYFNFDQRIWKDIGIWGRYGFNDKQLGDVFLGGLLSSRQAWSIGTEIPIKIISRRRKDDVCGIAFGAISSYRRDSTITPATPAFLSLNGVPATDLSQVNANLATMLPGTAPTAEKTMEVYYKFQMNKNVSISPDFQYIWSPGAVRPQPGIFVAGVRMNVTF
ncbi:MAG: carbohydrate porin [Candidatus Obscuribacterales bacterium]|nr:carbohydrate porin [Candidatus Obscuribacterales bacterium]